MPIGEAGISPSARIPFLVRHRRAIAIGAAAALVVFFAVHVAHWHWPYRIGGAAGELPLIGTALAVGLAAGLVLPRVAPLFRALGFAATASLVALVAFFLIQGADPFAGARSWRYAPERCDFAVEFPRPPRIVAGEAVNDMGQTSAVERALLVEIGQGMSLSAECLDLGRAIEPGDRARLLDGAAKRLEAAAARLRIKAERVARDGDGGVTLTGVSDEGRDANNVALLRRAEARALLGRSSLLVLWTWAVLREGEAPPPAAGRFLTTAGPRTAR